MFLIVLGILDIIVGIVLLFGSGTPLTGNSITIFFAVLWFLKGLWSILTAVANGFFFDFLGVFDLIAGVFLFLSFMGIGLGRFFIYLAVLMILKGFWSILMGFKS